jgi:NADH dehydrogenase [ubiquinone] 1 alpha subcomplex assembly factor 1
MVDRDKTLLDFRSPDEALKWEAVNDVVMGGISRSRIAITPDQTAIFQGEVSLENYGGFASMRTYPEDFDLDGYEGIVLRIKGDGKHYRLRLKTDDLHEGIAYQAGFETRPGQWMVVALPFRDFIPVHRGRVIHDAPPLNRGSIRRIGLMIADKQQGPFSLEIEWIGAFRSRDRA